MSDASDGETLRHDARSAESSRRLSEPHAARQDPSAPRIDGYALALRLGGGAYGDVWKAYQSRTGKWVALKVVRRREGVDWALLQREVERLIKLDKHPHVVGLLDADLTAQTPYYAMELMEGGSLERFVDPARPAAPEQAAAWAEQLASALAFTHAKGILHCDVKPANVLLDDEGRVRVADFGQSRLASEDACALGTLYYMAPEQALAPESGERTAPDVRWDLFGLGATLYAVLAGRPPHQEALEARLERAADLGRRLEEYRAGLSAAPPPPCRAADEDLSAILGRCLQPRPQDRYGSAAELATDLAARREGRAVSPLARGRLYRLRKFARRNAALLAICAAAGAGLAWAFAALTTQRAALRVHLAAAFAVQARAAGRRGEDAAAAALFARANELRPSASSRRGALWHLGRLARPIGAWRLQGPVSAVAATHHAGRVLAGGATEALLLDGQSGALVAKFGGKVLDAGLHFLGERAFVALDGGRVLLLETSSGTALPPIAADGAAFTHANGMMMLATLGSSGAEAELRFWNPMNGEPLGSPARTPREGGEAERPCLDFSDDGSNVLLACTRTEVRLWDAPSDPTGRVLRLGFDAGRSPPTARFSADGRMILSADADRALLLDPDGGGRQGEVMRHDGRLTAARFGPQDQEVLTAGEDGTLRRWGAGSAEPGERGRAHGEPLRHGAAIRSLAVSPLRRFAATGGADGAARLWSLGDWTPWARAMPHGSTVTAAAFSLRGDHLVTGGQDGWVRLWNVPLEPEGPKTLPLPYTHSEMRISPGASRLLASAYGHEDPLLAELPGGATVAALAGWGAKAKRSSDKHVFDPTGSRLVSMVYDGEAQVWEAATGRPAGRPFRVPPAPNGDHSLAAVALSPGGRVLALYGLQAGLALWEVDSGRRLGFATVEGFASHAAFSPDGGRLALSLTERTEVRAAQAPERVLLQVPHGSGEPVWSPDGRRLATADDRVNTVRLWDARTGAALGRPIVHEESLTRVAFSPDGAVLLSASHDGTARLVDAGNGAPLGAALAHGSELWSAALSPDSSVAATGGKDGSIRLWDARTGEPLGAPLEHATLVGDLAFSPDGGTLYAAGGELRAWDVSWLSANPSPAELRTEVESVAHRRVDKTGRVTPVPSR